MMKTNKIYIAAATLALGLAACSEQADFTQADVVNAAVEKASDVVQFDTYMGSASITRTDVTANYSQGMIGNADAENTTNLQKARFAVFGYYTNSKDYRGSSTDAFDWTSSDATGKWKKDETGKSPNFMYNEQLIYDDAKGWYYTNVKYWPNGIDAANSANSPSNTAKEKSSGKLSFFAYAPYMEEGTTATTGTLPTNVVANNVSTPKEITYTPSGSISTTVSNGIVAISKNSSPTNVWVKYVMPVASDKDAVDLLWGVRGQKSYAETDNTANNISDLGGAYNENLTKQTVSERVRFLFKHALAKIGGSTATSTESTTGNPLKGGLKVVVDIDKNSTTPNAGGQSDQTTYFAADFDNTKTLVTLKSVKIQDAHSAWVDRDNNGIASDATEMHSNLANVGWFNIEEGTWDGVDVSGTEGAQYNVEINNTDTDTDNDVYTLNEAIKETGAATATDGTKKVADGYTWTTPANPVGVKITPTDVFCNENVPGLMVIPGGTNQTLYFTVDYFVRTADSKLVGGYTEVEQVITNEVNFASLDPNKYYTIIMHLGMTSVKFEAVVADWITDNATTFDENGNPISPGSPVENAQSIWLPSNVVANNTSAEVAASATSYVFDFSAYSATLGGSLTASATGSGINGDVTISGTDATINLNANTTSSKVVNTVTIQGDNGKVVLTLTQLAKPIEFGDVSLGTFSVTGPSDLDLSTATITVTQGTTSYTYDATASADHYSYDNSASPKTITLPTTAGTYSVTVTQNDATLTADKTR